MIQLAYSLPTRIQPTIPVRLLGGIPSLLQVLHRRTQGLVFLGSLSQTIVRRLRVAASGVHQRYKVLARCGLKRTSKRRPGRTQHGWCIAAGTQQHRPHIANGVSAYRTGLVRSGFAAPSANDCAIFLPPRLRGPTPLYGGDLIDQWDHPSRHGF